MKREDFIENILNNYNCKENLLINVSMRFGKTLLAIKLIDKYYQQNNNLKILFVTPNTQLRDKEIPNEFKKWSYNHLLPLTDIVCYSSLHKITGNYNIIIMDKTLSI